MYARLLNIDRDSKHSVFLFGPRGVGKTSWVKSHFRDALYFDLLEADLYSRFLAMPGRLETEIPRDFSNWIIIDEIQKVPALLNEVHRLIEKYRYKFVLTGSSARSLRRKGVNLLAGRALTYSMHPLTSIELGEDFDISRSLDFGHLPAVMSSESPKRYLASYVKTYLREEVLQESLTRKFDVFSRFMETASFSQGEMLNYTEIAREVATNRKTISNYFDILEDLLLGSRLPVFTKRAKRDVASHPKFYFFDTGVFRAIRPMGPLDSPDEAYGPGLETLFLQEFKAVNDYFDLGYSIFYWRTKSNIEVDFIAYGERGLHAFEIKRKRHLTSRDFRGLKTFGKDYPMAKLYVLYSGSRASFNNSIQILPTEDGFKNLKTLLQ